MTLDELRALNETAAFNRWCGFRVVVAGLGEAAIEMDWHDGLGQYAGFLHAGVVSALVDTCCGFAAATLAGRVLAAHCSVNYLRPARGQRFLARARVTKNGKAVVFAHCELHTTEGGSMQLVATGETLFTVPPAPAP